MVKKAMKGAAKSNETSGLDGTRAGSGYDTEDTGGGFDPDAVFSR
jgi:hypothetical protein